MGRYRAYILQYITRAKSSFATSSTFVVTISFSNSQGGRLASIVHLYIKMQNHATIKLCALAHSNNTMESQTVMVVIFSIHDGRRRVQVILSLAHSTGRRTM